MSSWEDFLCRIQLRRALAALPTMAKAELCDLWKQLFHSDPSFDLRRELMIRSLTVPNPGAGLRIAQRP